MPFGVAELAGAFILFKIGPKLLIWPLVAFFYLSERFVLAFESDDCLLHLDQHLFEPL